MRIEEKINSSTRDYSFIDFFDNHQSGFLFLTNILHESKYFSKINKIVLESILNENFENNDKDLEAKMVDFFRRFNWYIFNQLSKYDLNKNGLSMIFCYISNNDIYVFQFGRFLAGILSEKGFLQLGQKWENFRVKSLEEINLLGRFQDDIPVKAIKYKIKDGDKIIFVRSDIAEKITSFENIENSVIDSDIPYLILNNSKIKKTPTSNFLLRNRNKFLGIFLILSSILILIYVWKGNNTVADQIQIQKEINKEYSRNNLMERVNNTIIDLQTAIVDRNGNKDVKMLQHFQESLESFSEMLTEPASEIKLENSGFVALDKNITAAPLFDLENIYLTSKKSILILNKKSFKIVGEIKVQNLKSIKLLDANLLHAQSDKELICINRNTKKLLWEIPLKTESDNQKNITTNISILDDRRLSRSISIVISDKEISVISDLTGEKISNLVEEKTLVSVSSYDSIEKSLYFVNLDGLLKVNLKIR